MLYKYSELTQSVTHIKWSSDLQSVPLPAIIAAGMSRIGKRTGLTSKELFLEAFTEALDRAPNLDRKKIGAVYVGSASETYEHQIMYGSLMTQAAGLLPVGSSRVEGCAAAGALALRSGIMDVLSGLHDTVLVVGVEKMTDRRTEEVTDSLMAASDFTFEQVNGFTFPSLYAMMAVSHMHKYGSTEEDMAAVAVKNHANGSKNPKAHFQRAIGIEDVMSSRIIAWPVKLYDASPISDGAAVAIITKPELARRFTDSPVYLRGTGHASDTLGLYHREDPSWPEAISLACREAYQMAKIDASRVDLAEVHDAFTINEILINEAAGFAERGKGHTLLREGVTEIGGKVAVNTSGGLKARGHPLGATGLAQIYEIYLQLIGEAGSRQVPDVEFALAVNEGGSDAVVASHVLSR